MNITEKKTIDLILELRQQGWGDRRIAAAAGESYGRVRKFREQHEADVREQRSRVSNIPTLAELDLIQPPEEGPAILVYDIETAPILAWVWSNWQTNVIATEQDWYSLCFVYKWLGSDEVGFVSIVDDPSFVPDSNDDRYVVERMASLFDAADVTVAHNGDRFDDRKMKARMVYHDIDSPTPYQTVDTKKWASREFANASNSLNELARLFGFGRKVQHTGFDLWRRCMLGEPEAWATMEEYNRMDVALLERLYFKLLPWAGRPGKPGSPTLSFWTDPGAACPKCGHEEYTVEGIHRTASREYPTIRCHSCKGVSKMPGQKALPRS